MQTIQLKPFVKIKWNVSQHLSRVLQLWKPCGRIPRTETTPCWKVSVWSILYNLAKFTAKSVGFPEDFDESMNPSIFNHLCSNDCDNNRARATFLWAKPWKQSAVASFLSDPCEFTEEAAEDRWQRRGDSGEEDESAAEQELPSPFCCSVLKPSQAPVTLSSVGRWRTESCCGGWRRLSFLSLSSHVPPPPPSPPSWGKVSAPTLVVAFCQNHRLENSRSDHKHARLGSAANTLHDEACGIRAEKPFDLQSPLLARSRWRAHGRSRVMGLRTPHSYWCVNGASPCERSSCCFWLLILLIKEHERPDCQLVCGVYFTFKPNKVCFLLFDVVLVGQNYVFPVYWRGADFHEPQQCSTRS